MNEKIQTGLRVPTERYNELVKMANDAGVSINTMILMLIDTGIKATNLGIHEYRRFSSHNQTDNSLERTR